MWSALGGRLYPDEWQQSYWCDFNDAMCFNQVERCGLELSTLERQLLDEAYSECPAEEYGIERDQWGRVKFFIAIRCGWDWNAKKCTGKQLDCATNLVDWIVESPDSPSQEMALETLECFAPSHHWDHPCGAGLFSPSDTWITQKCPYCVDMITSEVQAVATAIWNERLFCDMPILGDALEEAGCVNDFVLKHCREHKWHGRGCWLLRHLRRQWGDCDGPQRPSGKDRKHRDNRHALPSRWPKNPSHL